MPTENDRKDNVASIDQARKQAREKQGAGASGLLCNGEHKAPMCGARQCYRDERSHERSLLAALLPARAVGVADTEPPPAFVGTSNPEVAHFRARYEGCRIALEHAIQCRDTSEIAASYASLLTLADDVIEALEVACVDRDDVLDAYNKLVVVSDDT